jgi:integrase
MTKHALALVGRPLSRALKVKPPAFRLTEAFLKTAAANLPAGQSEAIQFEDKTGLGVRVSPSNVSFVVQFKLKSGRRYRETLGPWGKLTVSQARDAAKAIAGKIALGIDPGAERRAAEAQAREEEEAVKAERLTLGALVKRWASEHLSKRRPSYAVKSPRRIAQHFSSLLDAPLAHLDRKQVRQAVEKATTNSGPGAARNAVASLRAAVRWALSEDLIAHDPLAGFKLPAKGDDRERTLTLDEARRIFAAAAGLDYPAGQFVRLLMLTGCRRAEIAGLRWDEIVDGPDGLSVELPGARTKNGAPHHVPLSTAARRVVVECRKVRLERSPYVLTSDGWRSYANFDRTKKAIDAALEAQDARVRDWTLHDFRRTLVSILAGKPFRYDPIVLDKLLGHQPQGLSPIARIYQREKHRDLRGKALEAWGKALTRRSTQAHADVARSAMVASAVQRTTTRDAHARVSRRKVVRETKRMRQTGRGRATWANSGGGEREWSQHFVRVD